MNLAWSDTAHASLLFPVPCPQDSPVCLTDFDKKPQVFLLISECEFSKKNKPVGLACLVSANQPLEISWNSTAKNKTKSAFHLEKNGTDYVMSSQLSLWASELNGTHTCIVKNSSKWITEKTFQLPEKWKDQSSQKETLPRPVEVTKAPNTQKDTVETIAPSNLSVNFLATSTYPEMSSWLMCEVSGFFPQDIHLIWLRFQSKINTSYFATAYPTKQHGGNTFQTWSVLRIPVTLNSSLDTYTCVVDHVASETKLTASKILDLSGMASTIPNLCIRDEQSDSYMDIDEENGLWPTLCTFVALFLLTLLYSGFVTFIKVK